VALAGCLVTTVQDKVFLFSATLGGDAFLLVQVRTGDGGYTFLKLDAGRNDIANPCSLDFVRFFCIFLRAFAILYARNDGRASAHALRGETPFGGRARSTSERTTSFLLCGCMCALDALQLKPALKRTARHTKTLWWWDTAARAVSTRTLYRHP
jgi:hypothetical protein